MADAVERTAADVGAALDLLDMGVGLVAAREADCGAVVVLEFADVAQADADGLVPAVGPLQRAVPPAVVDVDGARLDVEHRNVLLGGTVDPGSCRFVR